MVKIWDSRDLTLVIVFAVIGMLYSVFVAQMALLITGIQGVHLFFIIGYAIFITAQMLLYEGRRWRFSVSSILFALLTTPTSFTGAPFDVLARIPIVINASISDLIFNSIYAHFKKRNKLFWWSILLSVEFNIINQFVSMLVYYLLAYLQFYPTEFFTSFINIAVLMLPVIIIESIAGGYIGHKVYERIKKVY